MCVVSAVDWYVTLQHFAVRKLLDFFGKRVLQYIVLHYAISKE